MVLLYERRHLEEFSDGGKEEVTGKLTDINMNMKLTEQS